MNVIFCHGLESAPHGRKYHALVDAGFAPLAPDFQGMALAARVARLREVLREHEGALVIGSSYGGITALCAAIAHIQDGGRVHALLLCAPALARAEPPATEMQLAPPTTTEIIHGIRDEVVPIDVSRRFAAAHPEVVLHEVDDDHSLQASMALLIERAARLSEREPAAAR